MPTKLPKYYITSYEDDIPPMVPGYPEEGSITMWTVACHKNDGEILCFTEFSLKAEAERACNDLNYGFRTHANFEWDPSEPQYEIHMLEKHVYGISIVDQVKDTINYAINLGVADDPHVVY